MTLHLKAHTHFIATDDNKGTDLLKEPIIDEVDMVNALTGAEEFMKTLSNLFEDQDSYDLITDNTKDHSQGNVIVLSSEEDVVDFQDPYMLEEIPIIEGVVISSPNENRETYYMGNSVEPPAIQEDMADIMEEVSQLGKKIMQAMNKRFHPLVFDKWMMPGTQEHNHNLPLKILPVEWQESAEGNVKNEGDKIDEGSHAAGTEKADTPSVEEVGDKGTDIKAAERKMSSALEPLAKAEKVLIRTERVTNPEETPADKPTLHGIQQQRESAENIKSETM